MEVFVKKNLISKHLKSADVSDSQFFYASLFVTFFYIKPKTFPIEDHSKLNMKHSKQLMFWLLRANSDRLFITLAAFFISRQIVNFLIDLLVSTRWTDLCILI